MLFGHEYSLIFTTGLFPSWVKQTPLVDTEAQVRSGQSKPDANPMKVVKPINKKGF